MYRNFIRMKDDKKHKSDCVTRDIDDTYDVFDMQTGTFVVRDMGDMSVEDIHQALTAEREIITRMLEQRLNRIEEEEER
jgi:DNA-binding HxlR family transcriptional regulator